MRNEDASKVREESREYEDRNAFEEGAHFGYRLGIEAENERLILFTEASQQSTEELKKAAGQIAAERDYYKELAQAMDERFEFLTKNRYINVNPWDWDEDLFIRNKIDELKKLKL